MFYFFLSIQYNKEREVRRVYVLVKSYFFFVDTKYASRSKHENKVHKINISFFFHLYTFYYVITLHEISFGNLFVHRHRKITSKITTFSVINRNCDAAILLFKVRIYFTN